MKTRMTRATMSEAVSSAFEPVRIGVVSVSDRASSGVYEDKGIPALQDWLGRALRNPITWETRLIPTSRTPSAPRCASWSTRPAATWCSPPAAPARRRAT
jgi:molybdopterin biosynthesis enzyme MoaB